MNLGIKDEVPKNFEALVIEKAKPKIIQKCSKFQILHVVLSHKQNKIWGKTKIGGPPLPKKSSILIFV